MRILFVNRFADGEQVPTARMLRDVADLLVRRGHHVTLLATRAGYDGVNNTSQPGRMTERARENISGDGGRDGVVKIAEILAADKLVDVNIPDVTRLRIERVWTPSARLPAWLVFLVQVFVRVAFMPWDACVLMTDPPFMTPLARIVRFIYGARRKVFWWTMDLYPESLSAAGLIAEQGVLFRLLTCLNRFGARGLHGIICLGERQRERLKRCIEAMPTQNVVCVPPWDYRKINEISRADNAFVKMLGGSAKKIALYAGNLGQGHSFADLADAARILADDPDNPWQFVFVCRGASRIKLERMVTGLNNVKIMDYLPAERTAELLWSADIHLITMADGWDGVVVPSKLYGVFKTNAPILFIGPERADTALEISGMNRGLCLPNGCGGGQVIAALTNLACYTS